MRMVTSLTSTHHQIHLNSTQLWRNVCPYRLWEKKFWAHLSLTSPSFINPPHSRSSKAPLAVKWLVLTHACLTVIAFKLALNKQLAVKVLVLRRSSLHSGLSVNTLCRSVNSVKCCTSSPTQASCSRWSRRWQGWIERSFSASSWRARTKATVWLDTRQREKNVCCEGPPQHGGAKDTELLFCICCICFFLLLALLFSKCVLKYTKEISS